MALTPPFATFKKKPGEFVGVFMVVSPDGKQTTAKARSGQPEYQNTEWQCGLSPCPQSKNIIGSHEINLNGYTPADTGACGDTFFPILPDPQRQKGSDGIRSEIGLHCDNNFSYAPGTAGCIGIDPKEWEKIKEELLRIRKAGYNKISLLVDYSGEDKITVEKPAEPAKPHWAEADYQKLKSLGIVSGEPNYNKTVTRAEMFALLSRVISHYQIQAEKQYKINADIIVNPQAK